MLQRAKLSLIVDGWLRLNNGQNEKKSKIVLLENMTIL